MRDQGCHEEIDPLKVWYAIKQRNETNYCLFNVYAQRSMMDQGFHEKIDPLKVWYAIKQSY